MADHWKEHHITLCRIGITLDHNLHKRINASTSRPTPVFYLQNLGCIFLHSFGLICAQYKSNLQHLFQYIWHHHNNCRRKWPKCYTQACGTAVGRKRIDTCTTRGLLLHTNRFCLDSETAGQESQNNSVLQNLGQYRYDGCLLCSLPPSFTKNSSNLIMSGKNRWTGRIVLGACAPLPAPPPVLSWSWLWLWPSCPVRCTHLVAPT